MTGDIPVMPQVPTGLSASLTFGMLPQLDTAGLARTTRNTMERLAPFSQMRLPSYVSILFRLVFRSTHTIN